MVLAAALTPPRMDHSGIRWQGTAPEPYACMTLFLRVPLGNCGGRISQGWPNPLMGEPPLLCLHDATPKGPINKGAPLNVNKCNRSACTHSQVQMPFIPLLISILVEDQRQCCACIRSPRLGNPVYNASILAFAILSGFYRDSSVILNIPFCARGLPSTTVYLYWK